MVNPRKVVLQRFVILTIRQWVLDLVMIIPLWLIRQKLFSNYSVNAKTKEDLV